MENSSRGFLRPTTTPTPDEIFDVWLTRLSGAELKILLYIVRRTFGFKKDADAISLSQICNGITTKDGKVLDRGTGLAKNTAIKAIHNLEALGLISVERVQNAQGEHAVSVYRLRFRTVDGDSEADQEEGGGSSKSEPGVGRKSNQGGSKNDPPVVQKSTPQQTESQQTVRQETESQQTALPPAEDTPIEQSPRGEREICHAGGADFSGSIPSEKQPPVHRSLSTTSLSPPAPESATEAIRLLVKFGVWRKRAAKLVEANNLTTEIIARGCAALQTEVKKGASLDNLPAVLVSRFEAGWIPPEIQEEPPPSINQDEWEHTLPPKPERRPLPPLTDSYGRYRDAYEWFDQMKNDLSLQMPRETFDTWLRNAELADYHPAQGGRPGVLTIRLPNRYAYEWVSHRLGKVIQRLADQMIRGGIKVEYTAPHLDGPDVETGEEVTEPGGVSNGQQTDCIQA